MRLALLMLAALVPEVRYEIRTTPGDLGPTYTVVSIVGEVETDLNRGLTATSIPKLKQLIARLGTNGTMPGHIAHRLLDEANRLATNPTA
jgi:hypothetical protein